MNPQQFELEVFDHLQTNRPEDPLVGLDIVGTVSVTINWNDERTQLSDKGVEFAGPIWSGPGGGPFTVVENLGGGMIKPVAVVDYSVVSSAVKNRETDTVKKRFRVIVTAVVKLTQRRTPKGGGAATTAVVFTASSSVKGEWVSIA